MADENMDYGGFGEGTQSDARRSLLAHQLGFGKLALPALTQRTVATPEAFVPASDTLGRNVVDTGRAAISGVANAVTGVAGLVPTLAGYSHNATMEALKGITGGGFNTDNIFRENLGTKVGKGIFGIGSSVSEWNRNNASDLTKYYQAIDDAKGEEFKKINNERLEADLAEGGGLGAHLNYIGRGAKHGVTNFSDVRTGVNMLGEAAGSLAGAGVVSALGKVGVRAVTKGLQNLAAKEGVAVETGLRGLAGKGAAKLENAATWANDTALGNAVRTSSIYGGMEGGGAMAGVLQQAQEMTHEQLLTTSPEYRGLLEQGVAPDEAKAIVVNKAMAEAGAIQGPMGAVVGGALGGWAMTPLKTPTLKSALSHIGSETLEEGIQSGTGTWAQNVGIGRHIDENRGWSEGIGEEIGQGAFMGGLSAGIMKAPSALPLTAKAIASKWGGTKEDGTNNTNTTPVNVDVTDPDVVAYEGGNDVGSDESTSQPTKSIDSLSNDEMWGMSAKQWANYSEEELHKVLEGLEDRFTYNLVLDDDPYYDIKGNIEDALALKSGKVLEQPDVSNTDESIPRATKPTVAATVKESVAEFSYTPEIAEIVKNNEGDTLAALTEMVSVASSSDDPSTQAQALFFIDNLVDKHPELAKTDNIKNLYQRVTDGDLQHLQEVAKGLGDSAPEMLTPEYLSSAEGKAKLDVAVLQAQKDFSNGNIESVDRVLHLYQQGSIGLSEEQIAVLKTQRAVLDAMMQQSDSNVTASLFSTAHESKHSRLGNYANGRPISVQSIARKVSVALKYGDDAALQKSLEHFRNLAAHMQNKVNAMNLTLEGPAGSKESPNGIRFMGLAGESGVMRAVDSRDAVYVNPNSDTSKKLYRKVVAEQKAVVDIFNALAEISGYEERLNPLSAHPSLVEGSDVALPVRSNANDLLVQAQTTSVDYVSKMNGDKATQLQTILANKQERTYHEDALLNALDERLGTTTSTARTQPTQQTQQTQSNDSVVRQDAKVERTAEPTKSNPVSLEKMKHRPLGDAQPKLTPKPGRAGWYTKNKDQPKSDRANKFIGQGGMGSSTGQYAKDWGDKANTGKYTRDDVVFISAEGGDKKTSRVIPSFPEIQRAMDAGATLITDNAFNRNRPYNVGERDVANYLSKNGYVETKEGNGIWVPAAKNQTTKTDSSQPSAEDINLEMADAARKDRKDKKADDVGSNKEEGTNKTTTSTTSTTSNESKGSNQEGFIPPWEDMPSKESSPNPNPNNPSSTKVDNSRQGDPEEVKTNQSSESKESIQGNVDGLKAGETNSRGQVEMFDGANDDPTLYNGNHHAVKENVDFLHHVFVEKNFDDPDIQSVARILRLIEMAFNVFDELQNSNKLTKKEKELLSYMENHFPTFGWEELITESAAFEKLSEVEQDLVVEQLGKYVEKSIEYDTDNWPASFEVLAKDSDVVGSKENESNNQTKENKTTKESKAPNHVANPHLHTEPLPRQVTTFSQAKEAARDEETGFVGEPLTNKATNMVAVVSGKNLGKMLNEKAVGKSQSGVAQAMAVANLDTLFKRAILGWTKPDRDADVNFAGIHRFFTSMDFGGKQLMVKLTVKETKNTGNNNTLYTVEAVEFNEVSPAVIWFDAAVDADGITLTSHRPAEDVKNLAQAVEEHNASVAASLPDQRISGANTLQDVKQSGSTSLGDTQSVAQQSTPKGTQDTQEGSVGGSTPEVESNQTNKPTKNDSETSTESKSSNTVHEEDAPSLIDMGRDTLLYMRDELLAKQDEEGALTAVEEGRLQEIEAALEEQLEATTSKPNNPILDSLQYSSNNVGRFFKALAKIRSKIAQGVEATYKALGLDEILKTQKTKAAYGRVFNKILPDVQRQMNQKLNAWLNAPYSQKETSKGTRKEVIARGEFNVDLATGAHLFGFAEELTDGTYRYLPEVVQSAILATVQELLVQNQRGTRLKDDQLEGMVGKENVGSITPEQYRILSNTHDLASFKRAAAARVATYLGLAYNSDVSESANRALLESLVTEIVQTVIDTKALPVSIQVVAFEAAEEGSKLKQLNRLALDFKKRFKDLTLYPEAINEAVLLEKDKDGFTIGADVYPVNKRTLLHTNIPLLKQAHIALSKRSRQVFTVNKEVASFFDKLGVEGVARLFVGSEDFTGNDGVNEAGDLATSVASKKDSFAQPLEFLQSLVAQIKEAHPNEDSSTVAIRFARAMTVVGRMQMMGSFNPQSSKLIRAALSSNKAEVPIDSSHPTHQTFIRAVGQAIGVKVDKLSVDKGIEQTNALLGRLSALLNGLKEFSQQEGVLTTEQVDRLRNGLVRAKIEPTPVAIQALLEYGRYLDAKKNGDSTFTSHLSYEVDGITNGVINSLLNFFSPSTVDEIVQWLENIRKGGVHIGLSKSWDNILASGTKDIYASTADVFSKVLYDNLGSAHTIEDSDAGKAKTFLNLLAKFNNDIEISPTGEYVFERGFMKSPVMVINYGAGKRGVAGVIVDDLVNKINQKLYEAYSEGKKLTDVLTEQDHATLKNMNLSNFKNGFINPNHSWIHKGKRYESRALAIFKLGEGFVGLLHSSVIDSLGESAFKNLKAIGNAAQIQSMYVEHMFGKLMTEALEKTGGKFLSKKEMDGIFVKLRELAPQIKTKHQHIVFEKIKRFENKYNDYKFSATLDGKLSTQGDMRGLTDIGVKAIPGTNISAGDALMMQIAVADGIIPVSALDTFDGISLPLDGAAKIEGDANKVIWNTWQKGEEGPLQAYVESLRQFLTSDAAKGFEDFLTNPPKEMVENLMKSLDLNPKKSEEQALIPVNYKGLVKSLIESANKQLALATVMSVLPVSINQMAGMHNPYHHNSDWHANLVERSPQELAQFINKWVDVIANSENDNVRSINYQSLKLAAKAFFADRGLVQENTKDVVKENQKNNLPESKVTPTIKGMARLANGTPLTIASVAGLLKSKAFYEKLTVASKWVVDYLLPLITDSRVTVVFKEKQREGMEGKPTGVYIPEENIIEIYLDNKADLSTLTHEISHVATTKGVLDYVHNKDSMTPAGRNAAENIDATMEQVKELLTQLDDNNNLKKSELGRLILIENKTQEQHVKALAEFIAYTMTQKLVALFGKAKRQVVDFIIALTGQANPDKEIRNALDAMRWNVYTLAKESIPTVPTNNQIGPLYQMGNIDHTEVVGSHLGAVKNRIDNALKQIGHNKKGFAEDDVRTTERLVSARELATNQIRRMDAADVDLSTEQKQTYEALMALFGAMPHIERGVLKGISSLYDKALEELKPEHFDGIDKAEAEKLIQMLLHTSNGSKAARGVFSNFIALAMVVPEINDALNLLGSTKEPSKQIPTSSVKGIFDALWSNTGKWIQGSHPDTITKVSQEVFHTINQLNNTNANPVTQAAKGISDFMQSAETMAAKTVRGTAVKSAEVLGGKELGKAIEVVFDGDIGEIITSKASSIKSPLFIQSARDLMSDFIGRTVANAPIFDMVKRVKSYVQQQRQVMREHIPAEFYQRFGPKVKAQDYAAMTDVLARADLASLIRDTAFGADKALALVGDRKALANEIKTIEDELLSKDNDLGQYCINRTKALGLYMSQAKVHINQPRNAFNIVGFHGENLASKPSWVPSVDQIDTLASLYALQASDSASLKRVANVIKENPEAVKAVMEYLEFLAQEEPNTSTNRMKGYIPLNAPTGAALITAPVADKEHLIDKGYELVKSIPNTTQALYYTPVSTQAAFTQGLIQTIRKTDGGVDAYTGQRQGLASGLVLDYNQAKVRSGKFANTMLDGQMALKKDNLVPVYSKSGNIIGYEVPVSNDIINKVGVDKDIAKLMGEWRGRQVETAFAEISNKELLDKLHAIYNKAKGKEKEAFININYHKELAKNFGQREAQRLMSPQLRAMLDNKPLWVRRDMVKEVLGYRNLSAVQIWDNKDPFSRATAKTLDTIFGFVGRKAYADLLKGERALQESVHFVKDAIVVKSLLVPAVNMVSNVVQLGLNGVSPLAVAAATPAKVREAEYYLDLRAKKASLEVAREIAATETERANKQRQLDVIDAQMRKLSIWPLIAAGEFTSLTDGIYKPDHIKEYGSGLGDAIKKRVDGLPKGVSDAMKLAYLSHDTKLYQLLQKSTQYGDFVAKAILYDHLREQGKTQEEALGRVSEEFINYEISPGAGRGYLESIGLMWFGNYFLRATKIGLRLLRDNPLAMLSMGTGIGVPFLGHIGTPLTDNLFGKANRGVLSFSLGYEMMGSSAGIPALPIGRVIGLLAG